MSWPRPQEVAQALGSAKGSSTGWMALCPLHKDKNASLSISCTPDGKLLVKCFAGCGQEALVEYFKSRDLWERSDLDRVKLDLANHMVVPVPSLTPPPDFERLCAGKPVLTHAYRDERGELLGYMCRVSKPDGGKRFIPITYWRTETGHFAWRAAGFVIPRPLYGLDLLSRSPAAKVLVVEGEKTADAARRLLPQFCVITWPHGSNSAAGADWSILRDRDVLIWPDNDEPGAMAALVVASAAKAAGARKIGIVELPENLPPKFDLADEIPPGLDVNGLIEHASNKDNTLARFVLSARQLRNLNLPEREYLIEPFLPCDGLCASRFGKTWFGICMALAIALGDDFLGFAVPQPRPVLYVDGEMPIAELRDRLRQLGGPETENLMFLTAERLAEDGEHVNINVPIDQDRIMQMLSRMEQEGRRPSLIILDNLSSLGGGIDENDNTALDGQLKWLRTLRHRGYAVIIIHHAGKNGDQRGASRREDILDTTIRLQAPPDAENVDPTGAIFDMEFTKTRGATPQPNKLRLELRAGPTGDLGFRYAQSVAKSRAMETLGSIYKGVALPGGGVRGYHTQQELADALKLSKSTISKHMKALTTQAHVVVGLDCIRITDTGESAVLSMFGWQPLENASHIVRPPF